jgi:23S rRNA pseudouridine1911/1915/1917 synthase
METIYEDDDLLVVNKPAGLVVDRSKGLSGLKDCLIVHRLDRDTSGLMVVAKTKGALAGLQKQFKKRLVKKSYLALVHGQLRARRGAGVVDAPLGRIDGLKFGVVGGGRRAVTRYGVFDAGFRHPVTGEALTLVEIRPITGRTHQIRVHLKHIGHPVVGDKFYSSRRQQRADEKIINRQFLHAYRLSFEHPKTGEWLTFETGLPKDLRDVLKNYG